MTKDEALRMALEALEVATTPLAKDRQEVLRAQAAIKEALAQPEQDEKFCDANCVWTDHHPDCKLAQPEQEPVAYTGNGTAGRETDVKPTGFFFQMPQQEPVAYGVLDEDGQIDWTCEYPFCNEPGWPGSVPLYTTPPQRKPLTEEELSHIYEEYHDCYGHPINANENWAYERAIEAAHGIKGDA